MSLIQFRCKKCLVKLRNYHLTNRISRCLSELSKMRAILLQFLGIAQIVGIALHPHLPIWTWRTALSEKYRKFSIFLKKILHIFKKTFCSPYNVVGPTFVWDSSIPELVRFGLFLPRINNWCISSTILNFVLWRLAASLNLGFPYSKLN